MAAVNRAKSTVTRLLSMLGLSACVREMYNRLRYYTDFDSRAKDLELYRRGAEDGLALPPVKLVYLVNGRFNLYPYYEGGIGGAGFIKKLLAANRTDMDALGSILDFGCGCGRVIRHWKALGGPRIFGCDYNPRLVQWCRDNLPFAEFTVNKAAPPLEYSDNSFDLVYALSVFTHLNRDLQYRWMEELKRVVRPGAYLLITTHGRAHLDHLNAKERAAFESGSMVILREGQSGSNECAVYHPEPFVRDVFSKGFTVLDFVPTGKSGNVQDVYLLRKDR